MRLSLLPLFLLFVVTVDAQPPTAVVFDVWALLTNWSWIPPSSSLAITTSQTEDISQPITEAGQAILTKGREALGQFAPFDSKSQTLNYSNTVRGLVVGAFVIKVLISIVAAIARLCQGKTDYIPRNSAHDSPTNTALLLNDLPPIDENTTFTNEGQTPYEKSNRSRRHQENDVVMDALVPSSSSHRNRNSRHHARARQATRDGGERGEGETEGYTKPNTAVEAYRLSLLIYADAYADGTRVPGKYRWAKRITTLLIVGFFAAGGFFASLVWTNDIGALMFKRWNCYYMTLFNMVLLLIMMILVELAFLVGEYRFGNALTLLEQSRSSVAILLTREQIAQATRESYFLMSYGVRNVAIAAIYLAFGRSLETLASGQGSYQQIFMDVCAYALYIFTIASLACNEIWRESPPTVYGVLVSRLILNIMLFAGLVLAIVPITDINLYQGDQTDWRENYGWKVMANFIFCVVILVTLLALIIVSSCQPELLKRRRKKIETGSAIVSTEPLPETSPPEEELLLEGGGMKSKSSSSSSSSSKHRSRRK